MINAVARSGLRSSSSDTLRLASRPDFDCWLTYCNTRYMEYETNPDTGPEAQLQSYGEGDTYLVKCLLPDEAANEAFERIQKEVQWQTMYHHG